MYCAAVSQQLGDLFIESLSRSVQIKFQKYRTFEKTSVLSVISISIMLQLVRSIAEKNTKKCFHSRNLMSGKIRNKLIHILPHVNSMSSCCSRVLNKKKHSTYTHWRIMKYSSYSLFLKLPVTHIPTGQEYFLCILILKSTCSTYSHWPDILSWYSYFKNYLSHIFPLARNTFLVFLFFKSTWPTYKVFFLGILILKSTCPIYSHWPSMVYFCYSYF